MHPRGHPALFPSDTQLEKPRHQLDDPEGAHQEVRFGERENLGSSPFAVVGVEPRQQENARAIGDAHQETPEAKLGGDPAVPCWASVGQAKAWHAATSLASVLELRGVSAVQLYVLLEALLPSGWDREAGIKLSNEESVQRFRELGFIGSATVDILAMGTVVHADGSLPGVRRAAAMPTARQHGCGRLANGLSGTCCQACPRFHSCQCLDRQQVSGGEQGTGVGGSFGIPDDQELALTRGSVALPMAPVGPVHLCDGRELPIASGRWQARGRADKVPHSDVRSLSASRAACERSEVPICQSCRRRPAVSELGDLEC